MPAEPSTTSAPAASPPRDGIVRPRMHHVTFTTTRLAEMIDWYAIVVGADVTFRYELGAWLTNDRANHRIALLAFPGLEDDPAKQAHTGVHHSAFEYASFDELMDTYVRLKREGITPVMCLDHGMTTSLYYADPDGNNVELQVDNFGDWDASREWMRTSLQFRADPLGVFIDPDQLLAARDEGLAFAEIHEGAMAGRYLPDPLPDVPVPNPPEQPS
jgi:catechol 2,3-dioxygenase